MHGVHEILNLVKAGRATPAEATLLLKTSAAHPAAIGRAPQTAPPLRRGHTAPRGGDVNTSGSSPTALEFLQQTFQRVFGLNGDQLAPSATYDRMGIRSLGMIELIGDLEQTFGTLPKTLLFEYPNLEKLARYFETHHADVWRHADGRTRPIAEAAPNSEPSRGQTAAHVSASIPAVKHAESQPVDIAIVGLAGGYPKAATLEEFWQNLCAGRDCIDEVPTDRWSWRDYYEPQVASDRAYSKWGGFIDDVDKFDPLFFNIAPHEAEQMDPQERLFLEAAWSALEDAGLLGPMLARLERKVGVFVGVMNAYYGWLGAEAWLRGMASQARANYWSIANRVSFCLDLVGPSMAVDTACSSSLTAIHLAVESILRGECRAAVAGGVNLIVHPKHLINLCGLNMLSRGDALQAFGAGGDGFVDGEGVGAVVLRRLTDALEDGDPIYGVIKSSWVNASGRTSGYMVPNPKAQAELIAAAIRRAGIQPESISYVEAHGTGTALGDPAEVRGLAEAFATTASPARPAACRIGSVKANIGHLESAAGIAGLSKVLLQMKHRQLVPSIHADPLNPHIDFESTPFQVQQELVPWEPPRLEVDGETTTFPRRAGVSSFGAGGANAHLIVEEAPAGAPSRSTTAPSATAPQLVVLSARDRDRLKASAAALARFLENRGHEERQDTAILAREVLGTATRVLADQLGVALVDIDPDEELDGLGLDFYDLHRFSARLSKTLDLELKIAVSSQTSLSALSHDIVARHAERLQPWGARQGPRRTETAPLTLAQLAHTLQVGREAMEWRLALVTAGLDELATRLRSFVNDDIEDGVMTGVVGPRSHPLPLADADRQDLQSIGRCWVSGAKIDWNLLHRGAPLRRVSLPTYPFARESYWLSPPGTERPWLPRSSQQSAIASASDPPKPNAVYKPGWVTTHSSWPLDGLSDRVGIGKKSVIVVFDSGSERVSHLEQRLGSTVYHVRPDAQFTTYGERAFGLDPCDADGYRQLFEVFRQRGVVPDRIIYFWSGPALEGDWDADHCDAVRLTDQQLSLGFRSVFHLAQCLEERYLFHPIRCCFYYHQSEAYNSAAFGALSAFMRSLAAENDQHHFRTVAVDFRSWPPARLAEAALAEHALESSDHEVRYIRDRRLEARMISCPQISQSDQPVFRENGVYLLTGGMGEVGSRLAVQLAERYQCRLALLGRSELDSAKQAVLDDVHRAGGEAIYLSADLCSRQDVDRAVAAVKQRFGVLHGVIHLARAVSNGLVITKDPRSLDAAIAAKVWGTIHLDAATANEPLDCFVLFSSLAVLGMAGASDYAFSCAYQNHFAEVRARLVRDGVRSGRTLAAMWPQWQYDSYLDQKKRRALQVRGVTALEISDGTSALESGLRLNEPVLAIPAGQESLFGGAFAPSNITEECEMAVPATDTEDAIERTLETRLREISDGSLDSLLKRLRPELVAPTIDVVTMPPAQAETRSEPAPVKEPAPSARSVPVTDIPRTVVEAFAAQLKIDPSRLDTDTPFTRYGVDSLSAVRIAHALQQRLKRTINPRLLLDHRTISELATAIANVKPDGGASENGRGSTSGRQSNQR